MDVTGSVVMVLMVTVVVMVSQVHPVVSSSSDDQPLALDYWTFLTKNDRRAPHSRERRAAYTNRAVQGFSEEEKKVIVDKHNHVRALEQSSNMMYMYWDEKLAAFAQAWADGCSFDHSSQSQRSNIKPYAYAGENLYASTGSYNPGEVVQLWYDEVKDYNYNTKQCSKICGHYTQVVWAKSHAVGCGVRYCPVLKKFPPGHGFLVACNYGPGGNIQRQEVYRKGKACSQCSKDAPYCVDKLCAKVPVVDTSRAASRDQPLLLLIGSCCLVSAILSLRLLT